MCINKIYKTEDNEGSKGSKESLKQKVSPLSNQLMLRKLRHPGLLLFDSHLVTSCGKCRSSARTRHRSSLSLFPSVYQKSIGTRGDDASSASGVNANRHVHPHARLEVRDSPFLSIYIDLRERSHDERSGFLLFGHRDRACGDG